MIRLPASLLLFALCATAAGCAQLERPTKPCASADDCLPPFLCCTSGFFLSLNELDGPHCALRNTCDGDYLPFLPEGAPCARGGAARAGDACKMGLTCCPRTLRCEREAACEAAPLPSEEPLALTAECIADDDCSAGAVCCGISYLERKGACRSIRECADASGVHIPRPVADAGVSGPDSGTADDIATDICEEAYCGEDGPRPPTAEERAACKSAFTFGSDGRVATPACLEAVRATRGYCAYLFRHRASSPADARPTPVLPAACFDPAPPPSTHASRACAKLTECGHLPQDQRAACGQHAAGLGYDTLSRVADAEACHFPTWQVGWAPASVSNRCQEDAHCPAGLTCYPGAARFGLCTGPCNARGCASPDSACVNNLCVGRCAPQTQGRRQDDLSLVERSCGGRINLEGQPPEMGCWQQGNVQHDQSGVCAPMPDPTQCTEGAERPRFGNVTSPVGYVCSEQNQGTLDRYALCDFPRPGEPDPCRVGACVPAVGRYCTDPCVVAGPGAAAPMCGAGEICVGITDGWGAAGGCLPTCPTSGTCPSGHPCREAFHGRYCLP